VTLRAWERRYGLVQPRRTETGHRVYTRDDVRLIKRVVKLLDRGVPIGRVAPLLDHEADDPFPSDDELDVRDASVWRDAREKMLQAISLFDEQRMTNIYNETLSLYTLDLVIHQLVVPTLITLGDRWDSRPEGIAEEHFFSTFLRNKLGTRFHHLSSFSSGPKIVMSCLPEERHELGLMMFALFAATAPASAQSPDTVDPSDAEAFREVISGQMAAFARDDGAAAFAFAAPSIQRLFLTPENFMAMVRAGYQAVYRPQAVAFEPPIRVPAPRGEGSDGEGAFAQPVRVTGPDGRPVLAMYHMERQPDGSWRIAGVVLRALAEREG